MNPTPWYYDPIAWSAIATAAATLIIAAATIFYTLISKRLWDATTEATKLTRESLDIARQSVAISSRNFETTTRPYVYIMGNLGGSAGGDTMKREIQLKNCGNFIATHVVVAWKIRADGEIFHSHTNPELLLDPDDKARVETVVHSQHYRLMQEGKIKITVDVEVAYKGVTEAEYYYREFYELERQGGSTKVKTEAN